jgi:hypothetical protein
MANLTNEQKGIYKIPLNCEPIVAHLNCKRRINKAKLGHSQLTTLSILATKTEALTINEEALITKEKIEVLYKTPKKIVIRLGRPNPRQRNP